MIVINEASVFGLNFGAAIGVAIEVECERGERRTGALSGTAL
jgi:hypothetical protein